MATDLRRRIAGKFQATCTLYRFARNMKNWRSVWAAYRRGRPVPSPLLLRNGLRIEFGPADNAVQLFQEIFVRKCYTPSWFYQPRSGDVVVDLGANIGVFSLSVASQRRGIRCHSFEPATATRSRLSRNVDLNLLTESIKVYPYAVGGKRERLELKSGISSLQTSLYDNEEVPGDSSETVEVVPLEEALRLTGESRIDLLKVDIEGAEKEMFASASPSVLAPVRRVVLEFHDHLCPGAKTAVAEKLQACGFGGIHLDHLCNNDTTGTLYAWRQG